MPPPRPVLTSRVASSMAWSAIGLTSVLAIVLALSLNTALTLARPAASAPSVSRAALVGAPVIEVGNGCTLSDAILTVNDQQGHGQCGLPFGGAYQIHIGADLNSFPAPGVIPVTMVPGIEVTMDPYGDPLGELGEAASAMPVITTSVAIFGDELPDGTTTGIYARSGISAGGARLFTVAAGVELFLDTLVIDGFEVHGAPGGTRPCAPLSATCNDFTPDGVVNGIEAYPAANPKGGAVYSAGDLTVRSVHFVENLVVGADVGAGSGPGGSAYGGAIYTEGQLTVERSAFTDDTVRGGQGDSRAAGSAYGADIALGDLGTATITDTVFRNSSAIGGSGTGGKNENDFLTLGTAGADGVCDANDESKADGRPGGSGIDGPNGGNGGSAGNATGVIAGGSVDIAFSSIIGARATAGNAGRGGLPQEGTEGGRGGDGEACSAGGVYDPSSILAYEGLGGTGGDGGDDGRMGFTGHRGDAVATIGARGGLRMTNTTVYDVTSIVPDDAWNLGPWSLTDYEVERQRAIDSTGGKPGLGGCKRLTQLGPNPVCAVAGARGSGNDQIVAREQASLPGSAVVLDGDDLAIANSTIASATLTVPASAERRLANTFRGLTAGKGTKNVSGIKSSIISDIPGGDVAGSACPGLISRGRNVFNGNCPTPQSTDRSSTSPIVDSVEYAKGPALVSGAYGSPDPVRLAVHRPAGISVDHYFTFDDGFEVGTCETLPVLVGNVVTPQSIDVDTTRQPRTGACDVGAYDLRPVTPVVVVNDGGPITHDFDTTFPLCFGPRFALVGDQTVLGNVGASIRVTVTGQTGTVAYDGSFTGDTAPVSLVAADPGPTARAQACVFINPAIGDTGPITVRAVMDPGYGDVVGGNLADDGQVTILAYDPRFAMSTSTPTTVARCSNLPVDFQLINRAFGRTFFPVWPATNWTLHPSAAADADATLTAGDSVSTNGTDAMGWSTAPVSRTLDHSVSYPVPPSTYQGGKKNGESIHQSYAFDDPRIAGTETTEVSLRDALVLPDTAFTVQYTGLDGIHVGETRQVTAHITNTGTLDCNDVWGVTMAMTGDDASSTSGVIGDIAHAGAGERTFTYTAPATPGDVTFTTALTMPGSTTPTSGFTYDTTFPVLQAPPSDLTIDDVRVAEGDAGTTSATFTVSVAATPTDAAFQIDWATAGGTATDGTDFAGAGGTASIPVGQTSATVTVMIVGDVTDELDEGFTVVLTPPTGVTETNPGDFTGSGTIVDDDIPVLSVADADVDEGTGPGSTTVEITMSLDQVPAEPVTLQASTSTGTASTDDFVGVSVPVTFAAGQQTAVISIPVVRDALPELDETFFVSASEVFGASIGTDSAAVTIRDDDAWTVTSAANVTVTEGDPPPATTDVTLSFRLNGPAPQPGFQVDWATTPGTATSPDDVVAAAGTITFQPGETEQTISVGVVNDDLHEADEAFTVTLSNPRLVPRAAAFRSAESVVPRATGFRSAESVVPRATGFRSAKSVVLRATGFRAAEPVLPVTLGGASVTILDDDPLTTTPPYDDATFDYGTFDYCTIDVGTIDVGERSQHDLDRARRDQPVGCRAAGHRR